MSDFSPVCPYLCFSFCLSICILKFKRKTGLYLKAHVLPLNVFVIRRENEREVGFEMEKEKQREGEREKRAGKRERERERERQREVQTYRQTDREVGG